MKIKEGFILREIAGSQVGIAVGDATKIFNGMIHLNETSALLFGLLQKGCEEQDLIDAMTAEYDVDKDTAKQDVQEFVGSLKEANLLD